VSRTSLQINSFNTGEVSGLIESRNDLAKFSSACKRLENSLPLVEGGAKKMPGTYFAGGTALGGTIFTASWSGNILTVTEINIGSLAVGDVIIGGPVGATIEPPCVCTGSIAGDILTVAAVASGTILVGENVFGVGVSAGVMITAYGTGAGGTGTYTLNLTQTVASETLTINGTGLGGVGTYPMNDSQNIVSQIFQMPSTGKSRLVPFQFSTVQGAILELSQGIIRVWEGATEGSWTLGLAQQVPSEPAYNPATAYIANNIVQVGPTAAFKDFGTGLGALYISTPYGTTNAPSVSILFAVNSADTLLVFITGSSPNQGIEISFANATPAKNAASVIQAAIRALVSLNSTLSNFVDLSEWTVTPDTIYFASPWIVPPAVLQGGWQNQNWVAQCLENNQNDEFPLELVGASRIPPHTTYGMVFNAPFWEIFNEGNEPPIALVTPYLEADLFALDCSTQSADILWIFHPSYPPAVVERLSNNLWQYSLSLPGQEPNEPAYRGTLDVVKTGYSALGQNISLISQGSPCTIVLASTSSSAPFADGSRIYINLCAGLVGLNEGEFLVSAMTFGSGSISVTDSTGTVSAIAFTNSWNFQPLDPITGLTIDSSSYLQYAGGGFAVGVVALFASVGNYPACGTLYQERLCVGGTDLNPTQLNGSVEDDYPDFISDPNEDDYAFQFTLVSNQVNQLINMVGTPNGLAIGTSGGVWIVSSASGSSISQTNVNASLQTTQGVSPLQPQLVNGSAVFVTRSARIVNFLTYSFVTNQWENTDLTRLNRNITISDSASTSGLAQTAFQMEPYPIFWAVRNDGQLIGLVFNTQDQVYAWFRVFMPTGSIESVAVISGQNQEDQVVVVVNRTINGVTQRYVEYFMPQELFHQLSNAFFVHSGQSFQGVGSVAITAITNGPVTTVTAPGHALTDGMQIAIAAVQGMTQANTNPLTAWTVAGVAGDQFFLNGIDSTSWGTYTGGGTVEQVTNQLTGLGYLLGQTVVAVGDEQIIFNGSVTADTVNFGSFANSITIGIPYKMILEPMNPVLGNAQATSKGRRQKFSRVTLSLYESIAGSYGNDWKHLHAIPYPLKYQASPPLLFTGNITFDLDSDWADEDTVLLVNDQPYPLTVRGIVPRLSVAEEG
jgi:hypothetical protein